MKMVLDFRCRRCGAEFERPLGEEPLWGAPDSQIARCPGCGRSAASGMWRKRPEGCMRTREEREDRE